jgi:hypothetical protein
MLRFALFALAVAPSLAIAQTLASNGAPPANGAVARFDARTASATRAAVAPVLDGRTDDPAWAQAHVIDQFLEYEPTEGAETRFKTEAKVTYDDKNLYVLVRMYDPAPDSIISLLSRRDVRTQSEQVKLVIDSYNDKRTAYQFCVNPAGVKRDFYVYNDNVEDASWDAVWDVATVIDSVGWVAEFRIPFSQLRFASKPSHTFGLMIVRDIARTNARISWPLYSRNKQGYVSQSGEIGGITNIPTPRRLEIAPYVVAKSVTNEATDASDRTTYRHPTLGSYGADIKYGLSSNLTLDATINPDFGQVEADPAEVNLTAFETRFPEKRPFFLEGSQLFSISHPNFYYSRRVGARPIAPASGDFVDYPSDATIVAAGKLTGRLPSRTSIGLLVAATDDETAQIASLGIAGTTSVPVAPQAYYNVGRVRQEFGRLGSTAGFIVNYMHRDIAQGDPLENLLSRNALAYAGDTNLRFKGGEYELRAVVGGSYVAGAPKAIERFQRASSHYAQRPDRDYSRLDPTLTSMAGWSLQSGFDRVSGQHWLWGASVKVDSENFETNDLANLNGADGMMPNWNIQYRETRPGRVFRSYSIRLNQSNDLTLRGLRQAGSIRPQVNVTWANFWTSSVSAGYNMRAQSVSLTRGGPVTQTPHGWTASASLGNRSTATTRWSVNTSFSGNEDGGSSQRYSTSFSFRPGPRWQLSANPSYDLMVEPQQYVTTITGNGRAETYNNRYVFAYIDRSTLATELRMSFTLRPDLNLDVYAEPFAASGRYYDFGELVRPRSRERLTYGEARDTAIVTNADGTRSVLDGATTFDLRARDFNTLSFRSNVVLRWEWRPGSTLYMVWQMDRADSEVLGSHIDIGDMFRSVRAPGSNFFVVKTSFWLPIK